MRKVNRAALEFGFACAVAIVCGALVLGAKRSNGLVAHTEVSGTLKEYELIGREKSPALRFTLNEQGRDFRVDPSLFDDAMHKKVPGQFQPGVSVEILVTANEYTKPARPILNSEVEIVWVHGLSVGRQKIFGLAEVAAWERKNRRWSYAVLVGALGIAAYLGIKWHRSNGPSNRSTR